MSFAQEPVTIDIIIADDHNIVRQGLRQLFALASDIRVVAEAANGQEVCKKLAAHACDLLLLDITMPGLSGVELIKRVRQGAAPPGILVLSMHNSAQVASRALKAGATGYITKDSDPETLLGAIRKVSKGGRYIDPCLVDDIVFDYRLQEKALPHERLSNREFDIFLSLVAGKSITTIAADLSLSSKTISTHKLRLLQKMGMQSIAELTRYAIEHRL
ncbi:MAG TPA: response regulator transcription factor [Burkholderiaceae bacterium]|nr:response regulator transcription factor [Burkholderiaceae bacterium]